MTYERLRKTTKALVAKINRTVLEPGIALALKTPPRTTKGLVITAQRKLTIITMAIFFRPAILESVKLKCGTKNSTDHAHKKNTIDIPYRTASIGPSARP